MDNSNEKNEVVYLYLDDIIPNRFQPRERFDEGALRELAASIKEHGVIQPIIVRKIGDKYEIIAGERRYKASALAGLTKIPAIIRNLDDKESSKVALLENLQRKNLSPIEEARTYQKILDLDQMTQFELAKTMGKSQPVVANKLRLLTLPDEVQEALLKEQISERHARSLLALNNAEDQIEMLHKIINNRMTVRETDEEIRKMTNTANFGLPGLESTHVEKTEPKNQMEQPMPKPTQINVQPQKSTVMPQMPNYEVNQNIATIPDVNTLREQAVDINDLNKMPTNVAPTAVSQNEGKQEEAIQPVLPEISESDQDKPFIDLEELLKTPETVPIEEQPPKQDPPKEETEELLEKIETSESQALEETLDVEKLDDTPKPKASEEKPLPSVIDTKSINVFDLRLAISTIRDTIKQLEDKGINIDTEEIDFEDHYQIVVKIQK